MLTYLRLSFGVIRINSYSLGNCNLSIIHTNSVISLLNNSALNYDVITFIQPVHNLPCNGIVIKVTSKMTFSKEYL